MGSLILFGVVLFGAVLLKIGRAWPLDVLVKLHDPCCAATHEWQALSRGRHSVLRRRVVSRYHMGLCGALRSRAVQFRQLRQDSPISSGREERSARIGDTSHSVGVLFSGMYADKCMQFAQAYTRGAMTAN